MTRRQWINLARLCAWLVVAVVALSVIDERHARGAAILIIGAASGWYLL